MIQIADGQWEEGQEVWVYNEGLFCGLPLIASFIPVGVTEIGEGKCLDVTKHHSEVWYRCYSSREAVLQIARSAIEAEIVELRGKGEEKYARLAELV